MCIGKVGILRQDPGQNLRVGSTHPFIIGCFPIWTQMILLHYAVSFSLVLSHIQIFVQKHRYMVPWLSFIVVKLKDVLVI